MSNSHWQLQAINSFDNGYCTFKPISNFCFDPFSYHFPFLLSVSASVVPVLTLLARLEKSTETRENQNGGAELQNCSEENQNGGKENQNGGGKAILSTGRQEAMSVQQSIIDTVSGFLSSSVIQVRTLAGRRPLMK